MRSPFFIQSLVCSRSTVMMRSPSSKFPVLVAVVVAVLLAGLVPVRALAGPDGPECPVVERCCRAIHEEGVVNGLNFAQHPDLCDTSYTAQAIGDGMQCLHLLIVYTHFAENLVAEGYLPAVPPECQASAEGDAEGEDWEIEPGPPTDDDWTMEPGPDESEESFTIEPGPDMEETGDSVDGDWEIEPAPVPGSE